MSDLLHPKYVEWGSGFLILCGGLWFGTTDYVTGKLYEIIVGDTTTFSDSCIL